MTRQVEIFVKYMHVTGAATCVCGASQSDDVIGRMGWRESGLAQIDNAKDELAGADNMPRGMTVDVNCRLSQVL